MSRNGYDNYSVGPFDAFYSRLQRNGGYGSHQPEKTQMAPLPGRESRVPAQRSSQAVSRENEALNEELKQMLTEEQAYEQRIEEACGALSEKERLIEEKVRLIKEQEKALEQQQQVLTELCHYGKTMEQKLSLLRRQIVQVRQQLTTEGQSNRLFTSQSQGKQTRPAASQLPSDYTPQPSTVEALTQFNQIPVEFIQKKLIEFRIHYAETQEQRTGWDRSFYNWVVNGWKRERHNETINQDFCPVPELLQELAKVGIPVDFCEQERKGFILYWQEQQATFTPKLWQERFKQWIQRAWRRQKTDEGRARSSRPTTEEFTNASRSDRFNFDFDEDD